MKSVYTVATIALMCSSILSANEAETGDDMTFASETLSLSELLSYVEDTVEQLIDADDETCLLAYYELQESLKIVYTLNCLHRQEAATILQILDECYAALVDAIDRDPDNANILEQSLSLFTSGRNYDHETLTAQPLQDWTVTAPTDQLKSAIEATDADLVYIQENVQWHVQKDESRVAIHTPSRLLYSTHPSQYATPKILIIGSKSNQSNIPSVNVEYKVEGGAEMKLGGKEHGKISGYVKGEVKDQKGNYGSAKISKEKGDDGCSCGVNAGKEKKDKSEKPSKEKKKK